MRARDAAFVGTLVFTLLTVAVAPAPAAAQAAAAAAPASSSTSPGGWAQTSKTASPQTVDVATLPRVKSPGEQSASRPPLLVRDPAAYAAAKASPKGKPGLAITKPATARPAGPKISTFGASFAGIDSNTESLNQGYTAEPPDTQIAVGATRILEMVNSTGQVYTKAGAAVGPNFTLHAFFLLDFWAATYFPGEVLNPTDPRVLYDLSTGRWYASVLAFNGPSYDSGVVLAISNTNDPAAGWTVYWMAGASGVICDQPKLGFSSDKFVIGCSLFSPSMNPVFQGALLMVGSKAQGLIGTTMKVTFFGPNTSAFGLVPAENMNSGISTAFVVFNNNGTATSVLRITGDPKLGTASLTRNNLAMTATSMPPPAPQNMSTTLIDTGDDRFMSAFVQGGVLYTSGGDSCTPTGDTAVRSCLRLVEVNLSLMRLNQAATAGLAGKYLINPTLGVNSSGDVVFEYSVSSSTDFVDIETAIQPVGDPNTFVGGGQVVGGMGPYVGFTSSTQPNLRWGDYGAVVMDPSAPASVYVAGEWSNGGVTTPDWSTWIAEVSGRIPSVCTATDLTTDHMSPSPPGTTIFVSGFATCVTGATPDYSFWIKPPGGVMAKVQDYNPSSPSSTFTWSGQVTLGTWTLEVRTRATTETRAYDSALDLAYVITAAPCTAPALTPSVVSPQVARTPVTLTANTTCGAPPALYQFWVKTPDLVWHMVQPYGPSNTYNWATFNTQIGSYLLEVLVKNTGALGAYDSFTNIPYSLVPCTAPTLSTGAATSPYISGSGAITLTATGSCAGGTQFEFFYQDTAKAWHVMGSGYGISTTAPWQADYKAGSYQFQVAIRPVGSAASYVTYNVIPFTLTGCGAPTMSPDNPSPQLAGTTINWTAAVVCTGTPQYSFFVKSPAGVWSMGQNWGPSATFPWPSPMTTGTYTIDVQVRNAGALHDVYDNYLTATYSLTACTVPTLSTGTASSPYASGSAPVTLTATGSCAGGTQLEFFYQDTANAWHLIGTGYGPSNTAPWPADFKAGSYHFQVALRPVGSTAGFVTYTVIPFTLTGCGVPTLIPQQTSPQPAGTQIQWNATVTCTGTSPQFSFFVKSPAGVWSPGQDWGPTATFIWSSPATKGTYTVDVQVRNNGAVEDVYDNYTTAPYTLS